MTQEIRNVVSVDAGFGDCKFASLDENSKIVADSFPSMVAQAMGAEMESDGAARKNVLRVTVGGVDYYVGKDVRFMGGGKRIVDENFSLSDAYKALTLGAIAYTRKTNIHTLMLGLPLNTFNKNRDALIATFKGKHKIPAIKHPNTPGASVVEIEIKNVTVCPQPMGALWNAMAKLGRNKFEDITVVAVDPGYYTLDWLTTNNMKVISNMSKAINGGMHSIYKSMQAALSHECGKSLESTLAIEEAVRKNASEIRLFGKIYQMNSAYEAGRATARAMVSELVNNIGNGEDVGLFVIGGGGATFLEPLLREHYKDHDFIISDNPQFDNVTGFQQAGVNAAQR